jgi:hypothetical protein
MQTTIIYPRNSSHRCTFHPNDSPETTSVKSATASKTCKAWYDVEDRTQESYRRLGHEHEVSYQQTKPVYRSRPEAQTVADFEAGLEKSD